MLSKKKKIIAEGLMRAELNILFKKELAEDGYAGLEINTTPNYIEIIILSSTVQPIIGMKGRRIRELASLIQRRFRFPDNTMDLYVKKVTKRGLSAIVQAESLRYKLIGGVTIRRACYAVVRFIMESGAQGCEIIVSGKLGGQRAKAMRFSEGMMIHSGHPSTEYVDTATLHVFLRQGVLGIKVKIMLPYIESDETNPRQRLPDHVKILDPTDLLPIHPKEPEIYDDTGLERSNTGPKASNTGPKASNTRPKASNTGPKASNIGPRASNTGPKAHNTGPKASNTGPKMSHTGPKTSNTEPKATNTGPKASNTGPKTSHTVPKTSHTGPKPSNTEPKAFNTEPKAFNT